MAVGVAGSFSGVADNPYVLAAIFGSVFAIAATMSLSIWAVTGSFLARIIKQNWQWHLFNTAMALLLVSSIASFWLQGQGLAFGSRPGATGCVTPIRRLRDLNWASTAPAITSTAPAMC